MLHELAAGRYHSCARRADGTLLCWGHNNKGQVGDGSTDMQTTPVEVPAVTDAVHVRAGFLHTCAIRAAGPVVCWGDDLGGQLGDDRVTGDPTPEPVEVQGLPLP